MMDAFEVILARFNYWIYIVLLMIGLFAMITKKNLIKKLIGMSIFQTAIILFYVSLGVKEGADLPIISHHSGHKDTHLANPAFGGDASHETDTNTHRPKDEHRLSGTATVGGHGGESAPETNPDTITNPLPHVLMLTAIVVGVATLGVGLSVTQRIFIQFRTLEEDIILNRIRTDHG